jgi:peroxiredoxin
MKLSFTLERCVLSFVMIVSFGMPIFAVASGLQMGDTPKLIVNDFSGKPFDLAQQRGKWVLIHFFASWCPGCKTELPAIVKLYENQHAQNLSILALSPEPRRKKTEVVDFMKPYSIPAALIAEAKVNDFGLAIALPTTYLLDPNGQIKLIFTPEEKGNKLDIPAIERLLSKK